MAKRRTMILFAAALLVMVYIWLIISVNNLLEKNSNSFTRRLYYRKAAVMTPYDIIPGGGERYLLTSILALQQSGYFVDILVTAENKCQDLAFLKATALSLRLDLAFHQLSIKVVKVHRRRINLWFTNYEVFYLLGNEKIPWVMGLGRKANIYMCQFPFDQAHSISVRDVEVFQSYDVVLVNSIYTKIWYNRYLHSTKATMRLKGLSVPETLLLYPPVDPFRVPSSCTSTAAPGCTNRNTTTVDLSLRSSKKEETEVTNVDVDDIYHSEISGTEAQSAAVQEANVGEDFNPALSSSSSSSTDDVVHISVLGRYFVGVQSKGHDIALDILQELLRAKRNPKKLPKPLHLYLIGNIHPEPANYAYVESLKQRVRSENLPVTFFTDATPEVITEALHKSTLFWHLTGIPRPLNAAAVVYSPGLSATTTTATTAATATAIAPSELESSSSWLLTESKHVKEQRMERIRQANPANKEHFGIAVVEAMFAGCIPIVPSEGGITEIIEQGKNGFKASDIGSFVTISRRVLQASTEQQRKWREEAKRRAQKFHISKFTVDFREIVAKIVFQRSKNGEYYPATGNSIFSWQ